MLVVRGVGAHQDLPGHPSPAGGGQRIADQAHRPVRRRRGPAAQPGSDDHRGRLLGADRGQLRVQALDPGVSVLGALLGCAEHRLDRVVDVQHHHPVGPGQQIPGTTSASPISGPGGDRVELADVPEGEPAQERPQRRGCAHVVEDLVHAAVAQQVHVVDAVRAGQHPGHQRHHLDPGRAPSTRAPSATRRPDPEDRSGRPTRPPEQAPRRRSDSAHRTLQTARQAYGTVASRRCPSGSLRMETSQSPYCPPAGHFRCHDPINPPSTPVD